MLYSAFTGKGISQPGEDSHWQFKLQYELRGFIGLVFSIGSIMVMIQMIKVLLEQLRFS